MTRFSASFLPLRFLPIRFLYGVMCLTGALVLGAGFLTGMASPVQAAEQVKEYRIDSDHTRVLFFVDHLGLSKLPGQFNGVSGKILFNLTHAESSQADIRIDATKLSMGQAALDKKLQGNEFFNTAKFPHITFKSTSIKKHSIAHGTIKGDLTLLGVTRPVTLDVAFNGRKWNHFAGAEFAGFSAKTRLRRSDFGMTAYLPEIGDEITLVIEVEAREVRPALFAE